MSQLIKANRKQTAEHLSTTKLGTIIFGEPGLGKTYLVRTPRMVSASVIAMEFQANGLDAVKAIINNQIAYNGNQIVIDDLGTEEDVKHFGNGLDPIAYIIQRVYDINSSTDTPIKLIFTTNYGKDYLVEKYGQRVVERIWEMCDRVILEDTNIRQEIQDA
jgi:DNA replication protein DnaC